MMQTLEKGNKKVLNAWAFYDWANSVYSLVITTAIFPIYYKTVTATFANVEGNITFLGYQWDPTTLYDYVLSFSFLIVAFISPILSGIADYTGNKLKFLKFFCLLGSISVMSLFFFKDESTLWVGLIFTILASIGFWGSIVFYNAYLPEIAHPEQQDVVSAKGFIYGYTGSIILMILSLVIVQTNVFGLLAGSWGSRITFVLVGLWWLGFAQITYRKLPNNVFGHKPEKDFLWRGFIELKKVWHELKNYVSLKRFLISYFFYSVGVQTIILMAAMFGIELGLPETNLILAILLIQFVAIFGAFLFSRLSQRFGNLKTLKLTLVIWCLVCFLAFSIHKDQANIEIYFYALGGVLGLVLGATQSLSRSTYSKMLPDTQDHATYFSFYDVTEKIAIVLGMFVFGSLIWITSSMQWSVLFLAIFFLIAIIILFTIKGTKYVK
jgi:UMF1 family MFS transporter